MRTLNAGGRAEEIAAEILDVAQFVNGLILCGFICNL
jgi:hypothetical protein